MRFEKKKIIMKYLEDTTNDLNIYGLKRLITTFIRRGKRAKAVKLFLFALRSINKKKEIKNITGLNFVNKSLINTIPEVSIMRLRRGSKMFTFPRVVNDEKKVKISLFWIKKSIEENKNIIKLEEKYFNQILDSFYFRGQAIIKKNKMYSLLMQNRPFLYKMKQRPKKKKKLI